MKRTYHFVNESVEIEINEHWAQVLRELDRQETNKNRKETRRHCSLEALDKDGDSLAGDELSPEELLERWEEAERVRRAVRALEAAQQELLREIYACGKRQAEIAREEGVSRANISKRLKRAYRRLEKIFREGG